MKNKFFKLAQASSLSVIIGSILAPHAAIAVEGKTHMPGIGAVGGKHWARRLEVSGVMEVEYGSSEDYAGNSSSDIALATVELAFDAKIDKGVSMHVGLLHEEDDTPLEVDEGYIEMELGSATLTMGQLYVPFGSYETNVLSDPLTLEIGETRESVIMLGTSFGSINASAYIFNGDTQEASADDAAEQVGFSVSYASEGKDMSMDIGLDYISNVADSDGVTGALPGTDLVSYVPAQILHANLTFGPMHVIVEHLMTDQFDASEVAFKGNGAEVTATNLEFGYDMKIGGKDATLGVAMQTTDEAVGLGLPKDKTLLALSVNLYEYTALTFEYATSNDYDVADGGTGESATSYTFQLAVGF
ncbi:MAG: LbtU family siderophore porin [Gammaproteobacteria bacterium]|nr:LbtU family siderophore porin [Gammaproteobacteria bacterium]